MKILWISPRPISGLYEETTYMSGSWIDAAFESCKENKQLEFHIVSFDTKIEVVRHYADGCHRGYVLPYKKRRIYLQDIRNKLQPDLVHLWGTEHDYMIDVVDIFADIPKVAYIQGVARNIAKNYMAGISLWNRIRNLSIKDIYRRSWLGAAQKDMYKLAETEKKVLTGCQGAIVENNWCEDQIKAIAPNIQIFRSLLPLKSVFYQYEWKMEDATPHTIFTNAGGYPIKGHHTLFEALGYIVREFPDTILYVPGHSRLGSGFSNWLRRKTYENMLARMVRKYGIEKNIVYTGVLNSQQMAEQIAKCNVFVMPSWVENHSSSLLEAMIIGAPCVSSIAGGVVTSCINGINALLHNPQDSECLAGNVMRIFSDPQLALSLSQNALHIRDVRQTDLESELVSVYNSLVQ